jgi:hypothetical protein
VQRGAADDLLPVVDVEPSRYSPCPDCQARAIENQLYVALSTLVGTSGLPVDAPLYAVGTSIGADPHR